MRLYDCNSTEDVCKVNRDNLTVGDFWILTDGYTVTLAEQKGGERATSIITIPRSIFNKFVRAYMLDRKTK